jgi:hypothetical protein
MPKPIVITDDSVVNDYGFRVMTDGGDLTLYSKNPILLWDHTRGHSQGNKEKDIVLPIGRLVDVKRLGSQIVGTPEFDIEDEFAAEIARKYEKGIINMASIGFEPYEWSESPEHMLPGQTMATVMKWKLKEVSLTEIGSNSNCHKLTAGGVILTLNDKTSTEDIRNFFNSNKPEQPMKKVIAALNAGKVVNLSETSGEELVAEAVTTLSSKLSSTTQSLQEKENEITRLKSELETAKTAGLKDKALTLVEAALSAQKIVAGQKDNLVKLASKDEDGYNGVKSMLDSMTGYKPAVEQIKSTDGIPVKKEDQAVAFKKHLSEGTLSTLSDEQVKTLYTAAHGKAPSEVTLKSLTGR